MKVKIENITSIFFVLLIIFYSCNDKNEYKVHESGLFYKIIEESDNNTKLEVGDYVELLLKYSTENDSLLFNSKEFGGSFKMQINKPSHKGGCFEDALLMMNPGDKYQFKILADSFYLHTKREPVFPNTTKFLLFDIQIISKVLQEEIEKERKLFDEQMKEQEKIILQQYIEDQKIKEAPKKSGLYYIETKKGKGKKPIPGDSISVHYQGSLLNGMIFDSSYNRNETFTFKLGAKEVIEGWEEGFSYMSKGGKAIFIIPSELAYGKEGYSTIIPPFSSLLFEVELIEIKNNK